MKIRVPIAPIIFDQLTISVEFAEPTSEGMQCLTDFGACTSDSLITMLFFLCTNQSFVRGRGGLYQQINRVPSPLRSSSPPRPEPQAEISDSDSDQGDADMFNNNGENEGGGNNPPQLNVAGQGGFLRVVAIDD